MFDNSCFVLFGGLRGGKGIGRLTMEEVTPDQEEEEKEQRWF